MLLSALYSGQASTGSLWEMLISSGSPQTNSGISLKSSGINSPKTEQTYLTRATPQKFSIYDRSNFSEIVWSSMLCSFILTHFRCSSAQVTGIHALVFSQAQRTRLGLPFPWALEENNLCSLKWMEILNSSDITEDSWKWDLNLQVLVFELKTQLYQK